MENIHDWCQKVTDQVRFVPDRPAIARELQNHYEDSVSDFIRIGYDRALSESRALAALGDAEEVGKGLDRAHSYFLGRLWQLSKWTLLLTVMFSVAFMYEYTWEGMWQQLRFVPRPYHEAYEVQLPSVTELPCPENFTSGIYEYSIQSVQYAQDEWNYISVYLNAYNPRFWIGGPEMDALTAVDSLGRIYTPNGSWPLRIWGDADSGRVNTACIIQLSLEDEKPEWIEVTHETAGWTFRLELPQEGGSL